ncbi:ATP-binding protein [Terasakiella sp. A23]|uniref:HD domain-containing protein n=1 Tax=Terasakiella sp. FCG-A23 TaxID=3080561 RepID=UPI002954ED32|nr:ATP-binding protein [Terasakiella sp. A23]MDV7339634.1 ATP-binding protein [Terasakiella sp. A23]
MEKEARELLNGVARTFEHYPSHGFDHSHAIIENISNILFDGDGNPLAKKLNYVEAFLIIGAAYSHDLGMRISDVEKTEFLDSQKFTDWLKEEKNEQGREDWQLYKDIRDGEDEKSKDMSEAVRDFYAARQLDFLIASYFRNAHALRSGHNLRLKSDWFSMVKDDDVRKAIAVISEGHGVGYDRLENDHLYSEDSRCDGQAINLRFLAILLRYGDLCDIRKDRTRSLVRNLTFIPKDSLPHWDQYDDIHHKNISPEKVAFSAYCSTPESYRTLREWCKWMEEESNRATLVMTRAKRHNDWIPPEIRLADAQKKSGGDANATIYVLASERANFIPHDWKFVVNDKLVMQRLVYDVYNDSQDFLRELIQNALDTNRAKMIERFFENEDVPDWLPDVDQAIRNKFPVHIDVETVREDDEDVQYITVTDKGMGMTEHIIQNYFLQIGCSYYKSDDFEKELGHNPRGKFTSQFGVGFLSVFAVSDYVEVETYNATENKPLKLILTKPEDYLLPRHMEKPKSTGTKIRIKMRKPFDEGELKEKVGRWCQAVELPVLFNNVSIFTSSDLEFYVWDNIVSNKGKALIVERAKFNNNEISVDFGFILDTYTGRLLPASSVVVLTQKMGMQIRNEYFRHGILNGELNVYATEPGFSFIHIDDRCFKTNISMSRNGDIGFWAAIKELSELQNFISRFLLVFFEKYQDVLGQKARLELAEFFKKIGCEYEDLPILKLYKRGAERWVSISELREVGKFYHYSFFDFMSADKYLYPYITEVMGFDPQPIEILDMKLVGVEDYEFSHIETYVGRKSERFEEIDHGYFEDISESKQCFLSSRAFGFQIVNTLHPVGNWLKRLLTEIDIPSEYSGYVPGRYSNLGTVKKWNDLPGLPDELKAPTDIPPEFEQYPEDS